MSRRNGTKAPEGAEGITPPQNLDAEVAVLGAIMLAGASGPDVSRRVVDAVRATGLSRRDFYWDVTHGRVYEAALAVADRGEPTDSLAVEAELERAGHIDDVGGRMAIHELALMATTSANAAHHAQLVREKASRREQLRLGLELMHASQNGGVEGEPDLAERFSGFVSALNGFELRGKKIALPFEGLRQPSPRHPTSPLGFSTDTSHEASSRSWRVDRRSEKARSRSDSSPPSWQAARSPVAA
jgi:hypothetical protein